ncbi:hypothetical protein JRO89_XS01G0381800 [Xanthoceras sorbifolium]|uniref:3-hydroxyisobutyryl-CoA hydrolase n=1 Tax=Xanthoceras sorbifolium TaxID=99658 RepID=A0ABQ8INZ7_9ROSI|nr:hypothetical protein JRO89_XS01G0381800 [Xanthoceras sorbifolium]
MAQQVVNPDEQVVIGEVDNVRVITLNRPRQLNVISSKVVSLLAEYLEKWEKDDDAKLVIIKGAGRAFSAGGDLKMFYDGRPTKDSCLEVVYRMYWLCHHIHTYKKTQVALVHGIVMGGGASLMVPMKFSVVTEKTVFSTPEASIGFHTDCAFSFVHSRLPGRLGEFLALTGARLNGKELVAAGLATHFVPSEKLPELEKRLISLNTGDETSVKSAIEEYSEEVQIDGESVLNKQSIIDECFSKDTVADIIKSFEAEAGKEGNGWIGPVLKGLKRSSPTGLKITLRSVNTLYFYCALHMLCSPGNAIWDWDYGKPFPTAVKSTLIVVAIAYLIRSLTLYKCYYVLDFKSRHTRLEKGQVREGRKQTLAECLKKEFRLTINILRSTISADVYEGIRALTIDKDNAPKWDPPTHDKVDDEKVDLVFQPFKEELELPIPEKDDCRWDGKYEKSAYATIK